MLCLADAGAVRYSVSFHFVFILFNRVFTFCESVSAVFPTPLQFRTLAVEIFATLVFATFLHFPKRDAHNEKMCVIAT